MREGTAFLFSLSRSMPFSSLDFEQLVLGPLTLARVLLQKALLELTLQQAAYGQRERHEGY